MREPAAPYARANDTSHPLRCSQCDVTWRGVPGDACWCCGAPGARRSEVRIVEDEPAA